MTQAVACLFVRVLIVFRPASRSSVPISGAERRRDRQLTTMKERKGGTGGDTTATSAHDANPTESSANTARIAQ